MKNLIFKIFALSILILFIPGNMLLSQSGLKKSKIKIGALALRGKAYCIKNWKSTAEYLSNEIEDADFEIVPLNFDEIEPAVKEKKIDFIIANSSYYVNLEYLYGVSRIATMEKICCPDECVCKEFGGVIFTRADENDINSISDIDGKRIIAVDRRSFGGWQVSYRELLQYNIDPFTDCEVSFAGTHDSVVFAIRDGIADVGCVRTGILEKLAEAHKINFTDFKIIRPKYIEDIDFPLAISTITYPEWPFAKLGHIPDEFAEKVLSYLLRITPESKAAKDAEIIGWTIPLNYQAVHDCLKSIRFTPYENYGKVTFVQFVSQYRFSIALGFLLLLFLFLTIIRTNRLRALRKYSSMLDQKYQELMNSKNEFNALFNGINDAVFIHTFENDKFGNFIDVNKIACERYGYSKEEFLKMTPKDITVPEEEKYFENETEKRQLKEKQWTVLEITQVKKSGEKINVEISSKVFQYDGKPVIVSLARDVTERKEYERKLTELTKIIEQSKELVVLTDLEGTVTYINPAVVERLGFSGAEEILGQPMFSFTDDEGAATLKNEVIPALLSKGYWKGEVQVKRKDGSFFTSNQICTLITDKENKPESFAAIIEDITEKKKAEQKLKESEERYARLADLTYEGIVIHDHGVIVDVNRAFERITGYKAEEIIGMNIINKIVPPKYHQLVFEKVKNKDTNPYEIEIIRKDGKRIIIEVKGKNFLTEDEGKRLRVTAVRDITERKKSEIEILKLSKAIEQSSVSVIITDTDGNIEYANPKFLEVTGYSLHELIGRNTRILKSGKQTEEFYKDLWDTIKSGKSWMGEFYNKKKNGDFYWENAVISPIKDNDGKIVHFVAVKEDITEKKEMIDELIKAKNEAEKADRLKSTFLAQMSHEIRTPINAMLSLSSLLKEDLEDKVDEDMKLSFDLIGRAGMRIIRTVDLLLNLSEIQAGTYEIIKKRFDLYADAIGKIVVDYKKRAKEKNLDLRINILSENTELSADLYTVEQIFTHLIDNAVKYTNQGKIEIRIFRNADGKLVAEVKDTGIGISEEYLPNLFVPFSQEEMGYTRKYEGNGIGMTLVKKYCELNNAKVEVESKKGVGTTFRVIF